MDALYQDLKGYRPLDASVSFLHVELPYFEVPWHYHPDIEILLVLKGEGRRFVGDHIENFYPEDLWTLGRPNLLLQIVHSTFGPYYNLV